jgi:hypothetical protein
MDLSLTRFIGIDLGSPRGSVTCVILDDSHRIQFRGELPIKELEGKLSESSVVIAAITSPITLNEGIMADDDRRSRLTEPPPQNRYTNLRLSEYELILKGFSATRTPSTLEKCSPSLQRALRFSSELALAGFQRWPAPGAERQLMEVHPDSAFAELLGAKLSAAKTIEGRIQRQLLLQEEHINVRDPMIFFEEITRHKMMTGQLPEGIVYSSSELNALIAAFTAWSAYANPTGVKRLGDANEGRIILPVSTQNR